MEYSKQPSTSNNSDQDYSFIQTGAGDTGITTAVFTGITTVKSDGSTGTIVQNTSDPNANQLPRGGIVVSVASTGGMGVAPLQGAIIRPLIGNSFGKSISGFIGIPTTGASLAISTAHMIMYLEKCRLQQKLIIILDIQMNL